MNHVFETLAIVWMAVTSLHNYLTQRTLSNHTRLMVHIVKSQDK